MYIQMYMKLNLHVHLSGSSDGASDHSYGKRHTVEVKSNV